MLFDTHAHYDDDKFEKDRYSTIKSVLEGDVSYILNAATNLASSVESISLAQHFENIFVAVGFHPHNVNEINSNTFKTLIDFTDYEKVVAIGEIGLDYYYNFAPPELQKHWFAKQINLAKDLQLPVIVHSRDAHKDTLDIIKAEQARNVGGVLHSYSGSKEMARELLMNNFYISIAGPVTYKNTRTLVEVVKFVPKEKLLIETDSPYLTPEPNRGKRNDSGMVKYIAEKIAEIKGLSYEEIATITTNNAKKLFKIDSDKFKNTEKLLDSV
jgi:TatD DNase family protein